MGGKFWLAFVGIAIACGFAGLLLFVFLDAAWYRWGFFGTFLLLAAVLLVIAWFVDRRAQRRYVD